MKTKRILIQAATFLVSAGCNNPQRENKDAAKTLTKVSLRQEYVAYSGFAGDLMAMYETDSLYGLDLKVEPSSDDIDPVKMVLSGENTFGITGADRIIIDNQKNADLVVIGIVNYKTPVSFIAKADDKVFTPKDFERVKVGVMSGNHVDYVYRALLNKTHLDAKKIKEVEAPFDLSTFITDAYDVRPIFSYVESTILEQKNIKYTTVWPDQYGVSYIGTVYFTKRETIEKHPEIVQAFINSVALGWEKVIKNPDSAIKDLIRYDKSLDYKTELLCLKKGINFFKGEDNKILWASDSSWTKTIENLKSIEPKKIGLSKPISNANYKNFVNYSFIENFHKSQQH